MDSKINPYAPGAGTRPPELAGRDEIIRECDVALTRVLAGRPARGILLTGLRGVGKTVLLNIIRDQASAMHYQVDLIEAPEGSPLALQIIPTLRQILLRLSRRAKADDIVQKALRVLKSFQISANVGGTDFGLKLDPEIGTADSGIIDRDLADLFVSVGEAARAEGVGVAILIDEVQYLRRRPTISESSVRPLISSWHGLSGPPFAACAGIGGPDKPCHDDGEMAHI